MTDGGVGFDRVLCHNDHGKVGQIMERTQDGVLSVYECPRCGRTAVATVGIIPSEEDER